MHRVRVHLLFAGVEALEPRVFRVDALEGHLQTEARGQRARERCLARADHAGDAEKHFPTYRKTPAGSNVENVPTLCDGQRARDWIESRVQFDQRLGRRPADHRAGRREE